ncbi:MAG TPA: SDR family oxidoreductase [Polyangiales bacterium]|nr:SDR family oxidoreductase [Polyangiales bacterium]
MSDKVALVTGGSTGIGAEICRQLLDDGYEVLSLARRAQRDVPARLHAVTVDLTDAAATAHIARELAAEYPITTIVHNAGAIREKPLDQVSAADLTALTQLHLGTAIALVQANLKTMRAQHFGRIVLVSTRAVLGLARRTVYSATKAGLIGLARTWALELAPDGITVNVVAPGPIAETEMFHELVPRGSERLTRVERAVPVGRLGQAADVARAVLFFAAPQAGFVTGQTLFVCGGTSVGSVSF